ncbi:MAG: hypothetical protein K9H49_09785 [Bacteroidales bacterium]|nr:hypothetical protein [Bacteroidales bacterium]MCF8389641.1 hypothetical protein [Bacteroidales bacterium]
MRKIKRSTVEFQKEVIMQQAENLGSSIEKTIHDYESDLTRIIFRNINEIHQIFDNKESMFYISRDL